ncbi:MAG: acetylglutamate kinase [Firmicutes bacterium]|nr:acetylglutamate kinase [Bacillota bacterium]
MYCTCCINPKELKLILEFRLLWNQHAEWTRMAINAIIFQLPNKQQEINRLLRNPVDFGKALEVYYGRKRAHQFTALLTEHLVLAADMIEAMMAGNTQKVQEIRCQWYQNGKEIAEFLGCTNPYWSYTEWKEMFFIHLRLVNDLAVTLLENRYEENIQVYDTLELEALEMADVMARGILREFPRRFYIKC